MWKILGIIAGILMLAITLLTVIPLIPLDIKIEWITYLGLVLMFVTGGAAFTFFKNALIAVITGVVTFAIIQGFLHAISQVIGG